MFGLTHGELVVIGFVVFAVLTARYWPLMGERLALLIASGRRRRRDS
ncbi:MAG TPA: hypothetical protein VKY73_08125 [Polyangiaceae bacterium]|nr:hypothetical protein [Polyangiaceae bacterium]